VRPLAELAICLRLPIFCRSCGPPRKGSLGDDGRVINRPQNRAATTTIQPYERSLGCAAQACCCSSPFSTIVAPFFGMPSIRVGRNVMKAWSVIGLLRGRDLRNDPDLSASNAAWSRTERRWGEGHHLRARPSSPAAGGKTRASARAACRPSRLLILFERQRRYSEKKPRGSAGLRCHEGGGYRIPPSGIFDPIPVRRRPGSRLSGEQIVRARSP
jgi:hypothetical protein